MIAAALLILGLGVVAAAFLYRRQLARCMRRLPGFIREIW